jgi:hypothetical protein
MSHSRSSEIQSRMAIYRYIFLDMNGRVEANFTLCWPSDEIAAELAGEMLLSSGFASLEIRKSIELIYRVGQIAAKGSIESRLRSWRGISPEPPGHSMKPARTKALHLVSSTDLATKIAGWSRMR